MDHIKLLENNRVHDQRDKNLENINNISDDSIDEFLETGLDEFECDENHGADAIHV